MLRDCGHSRPRHGRVRSASGCQRSIHTLLLLGRPEAGPPRLARHLATILPEMPLAEAIETTRLPCVAGRTALPTVPAQVAWEVIGLRRSEMRALCLPPRTALDW